MPELSIGVDPATVKALEVKLDSLDAEVRSELEQASKEAATTLLTDVKREGLVLGGVAGKAAREALTLDTGGTSTSVTLDGNLRRFAMGAEFGSNQGWRKAQFKRFKQRGYFMWPTFRAVREELMLPYHKALKDAIRKAGLELD